MNDSLKWDTHWINGLITVDEGQTIVAGQYRDDQRWNGWLCVRMKFDQAIDVLSAVAEDHEEFMIMLNEDQFILWEYDYEDQSDYEPEIIEPFDGGWYGPGSMAWCWEDATHWCREDADHWSQV